MMYIWNGFPVVCKRKDLSENLLLTIEKAEATIQNESKYEKWKSLEIITIITLPSYPHAHLPMLICVHYED